MTIQEEICEAAFQQNFNEMLRLVATIEDKIDDENGDLGTAIAILATLQRADLATPMIDKIDVSTLTDQQHFDMTWGIANLRGDLGEEDATVLILQDVIDAGFDVGKVVGPTNQRRDIVCEISSQFGTPGSPKFFTDMTLIKTIFRTGAVAGFEGALGTEMSNKIDDMTHEEIRNLRNRTIPARAIDIESECEHDFTPPHDIKIKDKTKIKVHQNRILPSEVNDDSMDRILETKVQTEPVKKTAPDTLVNEPKAPQSLVKSLTSCFSK